MILGSHPRRVAGCHIFAGTMSRVAHVREIKSRLEKGGTLGYLVRSPDLYMEKEGFDCTWTKIDVTKMQNAACTSRDFSVDSQ